jgi:hypothetical protein
VPWIRSTGYAAPLVPQTDLGAIIAQSPGGMAIEALHAARSSRRLAEGSAS